MNYEKQAREIFETWEKILIVEYQFTGMHNDVDFLVRMITTALEEECEACAQVVEEAGSIDVGDLNSEVAERIAQRIRNRAK